MLSAFFSTIGVVLAIVLIILAATFGFASWVMHLIKCAIRKIKWLFSIGEGK